MSYYNSNEVKKLFINSLDGVGTNSVFYVNLQQPITNAKSLRIRKVIMPNAFYNFQQGVNDLLLLDISGQTETIQVQLPTNVVLNTFQQFTQVLEEAMNNAQDITSFSVSYSNTTNRLTIDSNDNKSWKFLNSAEAKKLAYRLANFNIGMDKADVMDIKTNHIFPTPPYLNPSEVYINSDLCEQTICFSNNRRDCILMMPLNKSYNGICIYEGTDMDLIPVYQNHISEISFSITDRKGTLLKVDLPYSIEIDFQY